MHTIFLIIKNFICKLFILVTAKKDILKTLLFGTEKDKFVVKATYSVLRLTINN